MRVLVICTLFPPDSAVGAVKPYMVAHYLAEYGHDVTVIRYGQFECIPDTSDEYKNKLRIYTALGPKSEVERFERGEQIVTRQVSYWNAIAKKIPSKFLLPIRFFLQPVIVFAKLIKCRKRYNNIKYVIDEMHNNEEEYDIVFASYNALENIYAGEYASKVFDAKWIMEFRDPVEDFYSATYPIVGWAWNIYCNYIHRYVITNCDLCTVVSEGMKNKFQKLAPKAKNIIVTYNGYDSKDDRIVNDNDTVEGKKLSICYTGGLYEERKCALESLIHELSLMINSGQIDRNKISFIYAGNASKEAKEIMDKYSVPDIYEDHGYVSRDESQELQQNSDIFLVLSWNTKASQGVLTGKFYEGIRARKPILSVVTGDLPNSELWNLNKKYHYGYCYEICKGEKEKHNLKSFILGMYERKFSKQGIRYIPNPDLVKDFNYKNIIKGLEERCLELIEEDTK